MKKKERLLSILMVVFCLVNVVGVYTIDYFELSRTWNTVIVFIVSVIILAVFYNYKKILENYENIVNNYRIKKRQKKALK